MIKKIESQDVALLTFKVRSSLKVKNKYIERNYSQSGDSTFSILGLLDRSQFSLSNEYKIIRVSYIYR